MSAASYIHRTIDFLPAEVRGPWTAGRKGAITADGTPVATVSGWRGTFAEGTIAEHIVRLASPDAAAALAELLDAIDLPPGPLWEHGVRLKAIAVHEALTREGNPS